MGRKIDKKHRLWIKTDTEELLKKNPAMTWRQLAARKNIHVSTLRTIMREDGRSIKRTNGVEV